MIGSRTQYNLVLACSFCWLIVTFCRTYPGACLVRLFVLWVEYPILVRAVPVRNWELELESG